MSNPDYDRDVREYGFCIVDKNMDYGTGDCLGIIASNVEENVVEFCKNINQDPNTIINLKRNDGQTMELLESMPLHQLFTEVLDVFGRPNRRFYEFMAKVATDES